jgi:hypothetical protein
MARIAWVRSATEKSVSRSALVNWLLRILGSLAATNAPPVGPRFSVMKPLISSVRSASRTVLRLTWNCAASARSVGSLSPRCRLCVPKT